MHKTKTTNPGVVPHQFDVRLLKSQLRPVSWCPKEGQFCAAIDTSFGGKPTRKSDDTAMVAGVIQPADDGKEPQSVARPSVLWIKHLHHGKWDAREISFQMGYFFDHYLPEDSDTVIEKINGLEFLKVLIEDKFELKRMKHRLIWTPPSKIKDAKIRRINELVKLHKQDRLRIPESETANVFIKQAERWCKGGQHDDLLDAAGLIAVNFM